MFLISLQLPLFVEIPFLMFLNLSFSLLFHVQLIIVEVGLQTLIKPYEIAFTQIYIFDVSFHWVNVQ